MGKKNKIEILAEASATLGKEAAKAATNEESCCSEVAQRLASASLKLAEAAAFLKENAIS